MNWRAFGALGAAFAIRYALVRRYFPDYRFMEPFELKSFLTDVSAFLFIFGVCLSLINVFSDWHSGR